MPEYHKLIKWFIVAKVIKLGQLGDELKKMLIESSQKEIKAFERAYRATVIDTLSSILIDTPVDKGSLRGSWILDSRFNQSLVRGSIKNKGRNYVKTKMGQLQNIGSTLYFFNNQPYAKTVEFGGYPNPVKKGTYNRRTKKYEKRSSKGFSKLAPQGMVRLNTMTFGKRLRAKWRRQRDNLQ